MQFLMAYALTKHELERHRTQAASFTTTICIIIAQ